MRARTTISMAALLAVATSGCDPWALLLTRTDTLYCERAADCADPARAICDTVAHECVARTPTDMTMCASSKDCSADLPVCQGGVCRACGGSTDDGACAQRDAAAPRCAATGGRCVACRADTSANDCKSPQAPACDALTSLCRACRIHAECPSGACRPDGSCAPAGQVAFVDNGGRKIADCKTMGTHDGGPKTPYCDVQDAIAAMPALPYIVVAGSAEAYGPVVIAKGNVSLLGPGLRVVPTARIGVPSATPAIEVQGNMTAAEIMGLEVTGASAGAAGIFCSAAGGATLRFVRSSVHDNNGVGIQATNCNLTVDASQITSNQGGAISLSGGTYTITNCFISGNNGTTASAVALGDGAGGTFAFNTVVKNLNGNGLGGITCGLVGMPKAIDHSIVWGNTQDSGTQFAGKCMLTNVVTGFDSVIGATQLDPTFVDVKQSDFHLKEGDAKNAACCVDKIDSPPSPNRDHDFDGGKRPRGARWDIGAHEVM